MQASEPIIIDCARKHGVADEDILHAYRQPIRRFELDEDLRMIIGGTASGAVIEVGYVLHDGMPLIVHAMPARDKFLPGR